MTGKGKNKNSGTPKSYGSSSSYFERTLERMCLFDDVMLRVALDDNIPLAGLLLRIVLGEPKLEVKSVTTQRRMNINVKTKGVIFDALVLLADGRQVVIEMQIKDEKNIFHRSRFYSDMLDAHALLQGSPYTELPDRIIVVFCDWDVFGQGKPVYNVGTWLEGDVFKPVDMGMRYVYVNMTYNGDDDYGRLNNDLAQPSGGFFHFRETEEARELIFEAPWRDQMYTDLSDLIAEMNADEIKAVKAESAKEIEAVRAESAREIKAAKEEVYHERQVIARRLQEEGFNQDRISYLVNASPAEVRRMLGC